MLIKKVQEIKSAVLSPSPQIFSIDYNAIALPLQDQEKLGGVEK